MLVHIAIKNLAIVKKVDLTLAQGLTAITGETGAGKSIALDALGLCLGDRAESNMVRKGSEKAEVVAHFDVSGLPGTQAFLAANELQQDDNLDECFIRRVINSEGRSKAFVNGVPVNLAQLKSLGEKLALIHSQHAHYQFLKPDYQAKLLDQYSQHHELLTSVKSAYTDFVQSQKALDELNAQQQQRIDRCNLLAYQVQELDDFSIGEQEFTELESEFKKLSNTQELSENTASALNTIKYDEQHNILHLLSQSIKSVEQISEFDDSVQAVQEALQSAHIQIEEAAHDLDSYHSQLEADPAQIQAIEARYAQCLELARKHQIQPETLYQTHLQLAQEYQSLKQQEDDLSSLKLSVQNKLAEYTQCAEKLAKSRRKHAIELGNELQSSVREMNLPHAKLKVQVSKIENTHPRPSGLDHVEIHLSLNPGQTLEAMEKVVSGGELSRIGLAMQVISSKDSLIPTMVFDEVDSGISGPTAALIGRLLRKLGSHSQVVCVTHLPQVAAQAHHQLFVSKATDGKTTETNLLELTKQERVNEIARLLAGDELTDTAIANAKDLLKIN